MSYQEFFELSVLTQFFNQILDEYVNNGIIINIAFPLDWYTKPIKTFISQYLQSLCVSFKLEQNYVTLFPDCDEKVLPFCDSYKLSFQIQTLSTSKIAFVDDTLTGRVH